MGVSKMRVLLASLLLLTPILWAQEKKEPPPRTVDVEKKEEIRTPRESRLPKIDLPEFVITGREVIDLPASSKVGQGDSLASLVDASRLSGRGEKSRGGGPAGKSSANVESPDAYDGKLELGYGRFNSFYGQGWFGKKYGEGDFNLHGRFYRHGAYVAFANAREGEIDAAGSIYLPKNSRLFAGSKVTGRVGYEGKAYRFFGSPTPSQERMVAIPQVGLGLSSPLGSEVTYDASLNFRRLTVEDKDKSTEDELTISLRTAHQFTGLHVKGEFFYGSSYLDQSFSGKDPQFLSANVGLRKLLFDKLDVSAGVGLFHYRNFDRAFTSKLYPSVGLQYYLPDGLTIFALFDPTVERNSLGRALSENRFISNDLVIYHQDIFVSLSGGVQFEAMRRGSGRIYVNYQRVRNFPMYIDPSTLVYIAVVPAPYADWNVSYGGVTRFISLNGELVVDLTSEDRLSGTMRILSSHNSNSDRRVPYLPSVQFTSNYSHRFPFGLSIQLTGRFVGRRPIDISESQHLNSFFLLGANAEYRIVRNVSVYFNLNNILDERYSLWKFYQEVPFTATGGVSVRW